MIVKKREKYNYSIQSIYVKYFFPFLLKEAVEKSFSVFLSDVGER